MSRARSQKYLTRSFKASFVSSTVLQLLYGRGIVRFILSPQICLMPVQCAHTARSIPSGRDGLGSHFTPCYGRCYVAVAFFIVNLIIFLVDHEVH